MIGPAGFNAGPRRPDEPTHDRHGNYIGPDRPGKGVTCCNITACQEDLRPGFRWWNRAMNAWYCQRHAFRINEGNTPWNDGRPLCIREDKMTTQEICEAVAEQP